MTEEEYRKILKDKLIIYRDSLNLSDEITFGVEIEYENIVNANVSYFLHELISYNNSVHGWSNTTEPDLFEWNRLGEEMNGEITSPILKDRPRTWRNLKLVLELLRSKGAVITEKCGGHVNVGSHILGDNIKYWRNFLLLWILYEEEIYKFSSGEFDVIRGNYHWLFETISNEINLEKLIKYRKFNSLPLCLFDKEHDIYIGGHDKKSLPKNRIEFRLPNGTLNEEVWQNYINFFTKFVFACKKELDIEKVKFNIEKNIHSAVDLANYIFDNDIDKQNFLIQALKTNKVYTKKLQKHITDY